MQCNHRSTIRILAIAFSVVLFGGTAQADKPSWAGSDKSTKHQPKHEAGGMEISVHFGDHQRAMIRDYYGKRTRAGHCPPGLAKKHNGCLPPGQAKKWSMGQPLPRDVVVYDLPSRITVKLGTPPAGHRYVRVAADILLIAVGTGMVVDAIEDIGKM